MTMEHVTLHDVSAIEKEHEDDQRDLSLSLLPFIPTSQEGENKSIVSTISDKTFVKSSVKGFSSDDEEEEDDETIIEDSFSYDPKEKDRPLLLTADRSIRRPLISIEEDKSLLSSIVETDELPPPLSLLLNTDSTHPTTIIS